MTFWRTRARLPPSEVVPHPETVHMVPSAYLVIIMIVIIIIIIILSNLLFHDGSLETFGQICICSTSLYSPVRNKFQIVL